MKILSLDQLSVGNKVVKMQFTDGQLVFIAKAYMDLTGRQCDPHKMTDQQISTVFKLLHNKAKIQQSRKMF